MIFWKENREAELGLEAAGPLNLVVLEAKTEAEGDEVQRVFTEAEDTRRVCLTQLVAIVFYPSPSLSRRDQSTTPARERVFFGLDIDSFNSFSETAGNKDDDTRPGIILDNRRQAIVTENPEISPIRRGNLLLL